MAGHLEEYRALGGVSFALIRDRSGVIQVTLKKGETEPAMFEAVAATPRESVVEVTGTVLRSAKSRRGVELRPSSFSVLAPSEVPLPLGIVDRVGADLSTRLDHRVLDLRKREVLGLFELRAAVLAGLRSALRTQGFLEVETPKLLRQGAEGGATLFPVTYFEERAYLAQSPQLYKQMLMGAGFERVYEIAPAFRAEPSDTVRHITEFTSFDAEMAYPHDAEEIRSVLESVVKDALALAKQELAREHAELAERIPAPRTPFPRVPFRDAAKLLGRGPEIDLTTEEEKRLGELLPKEHGNPFYFLTEYPSSVKQLTFYAQRQETDPTLTGYFDLAYNGVELASGGPREHRIDRLLANMKGAGLDPAQFPGYLEAFRFGMPPHGGWGFGIDRLLWAISGVPNIRETRLFPRDRYRLDP